jgi:hypothetical protein
MPSYYEDLEEPDIGQPLEGAEDLDDPYAMRGGADQFGPTMDDYQFPSEPAVEQPPPPMARNEYAQIIEGGRQVDNTPVQTYGTRADGSVIMDAADRPDRNLPFAMSGREWAALGPQGQQQVMNDPRAQAWQREQQAENMRQQQLGWERQMQTLPLTHAERRHMMQLQQGLSSVQQDVMNGQISAQDGQRLQGMIQQGLTGYQAREALSRQMHREQRDRLLQTQEATAQVRLAQARQFQASQGPDGTFQMPMYDANNQAIPGQFQPGRYQFNRHGEIMQVPGTTNARGGDQQMLQSENREVARIESQIRQEINDARKPRMVNGVRTQDADAMPEWASDHPNAGNSQAAIRMERERRLADWRERNGIPEAQMVPSGGPPQGEGGQGGAPQGGRPPNTVTDHLGGLRRMVTDASHLDDAGRATVTQDMDAIQEILRQYPGGPATMPEEAKNRYEALGRKVAGSLRPRVPVRERAPLLRTQMEPGAINMPFTSW